MGQGSGGFMCCTPFCPSCTALLRAHPPTRPPTQPPSPDVARVCGIVVPRPVVHLAEEALDTAPHAVGVVDVNVVVLTCMQVAAGSAVQGRV